MRVSQVRKLLLSGSLFLLVLGASSSAWAQAATLGRGLEQMVQLYEFGNPKLPDVMKLHLAASPDTVLVHVRLAPGATAQQVLPGLTASGFLLQAVSKMDPSLLEGYLPLGFARSAAATAGVKNILAVQRPVRNAGAVQSQAVAVEKADLAQARGFDGTGTKLGAMSDSYDTCTTCSTHAAQDIATGDLPAAGVVVLEDSPHGTDEGRAMLQLVHDIAPGAALGFATAFNGEVDFSNNILALRSTFHADVEVDDVTYYDEPMFSNGLLEQTVDEVVKQGVAYFSSAGNNGLEAYEAEYSPVPFNRALRLVAEGKSNLDLASLMAFNIANGLPIPKSLHNFNAPHFTVRNPEGVDGRDCRWGHHHEDVAISQGYNSYFGDIGDFQWDEPFFLGKVQTIYFVYLFDADGTFEDPTNPSSNVFFTFDDNVAEDAAIQLWAVNPGNYQIVIAKMNDGPARRIKYINVNGTGESERQDAPSTWGHNASQRGQTVAAMYYPIANFPEDFSSPGPLTILFDNAGNRLHKPEIRQAPQITAIDGVDTTFFGGDTDGNGLPNFFGTSAAAPDAAAAGLLVIQSEGGPGSIRPERVYDRLQDTATPVPLSGDRTRAFAKAGPVFASANGDFARQTDYWRLEVDHTSHTVSSVSINLTTPNLLWSSPASTTTGFRVGKAKGLLPTDVTATRSADRTTLTLTFKPGTFGAGDELTFANFIFPSILPFQFQFDADRTAGGLVTVTLDDGSTATDTFHVEKLVAPNVFTGAGLVNADAATRHHHH
ncbi:MAG TPA: hypothetical protein VMT05_14115 [Terriglobales bacterium]|nr:hypothetical protein [Terriglobales bacterium]